jgi:hypothetical protein
VGTPLIKRRTPWTGTATAITAAEVSTLGTAKYPHGQRRGQPAALGKGAAEARIVGTLRDHGGRLDASVRSLAAISGAKRATVHNALCGLLAAGMVARAGDALVLRV